MKLWLIGGTIVGLIGFSFYLAATKRSSPAPFPADTPVVVAEQPQTPVAPIVLQQVRDVSDLDPLLDPPAIPLAEPAASGPVITRVGFEEAVPGIAPPREVKPIPKAVDEMTAEERLQIFSFYIGLFGGN